ncbi:MAG TPA: hypothetical protein DFS52_02345 [Myxococcales bacterium]|nr:hypothetical protein [Myxococcales bacterium]
MPPPRRSRASWPNALRKPAPGKSATEEKRAAETEKTATWSACYRLRAAVGARARRVASLLEEARRGSGK